MPENEGYENVWLDLHEYHAFGPIWNGAAGGEDHGWPLNLNRSCEFKDFMTVQTLPTVVGEWSLAITDCQEYLDGGYYAPYVPPNASEETCEYYNGDFENYTPEYR